MRMPDRPSTSSVTRRLPIESRTSLDEGDKVYYYISPQEDLRKRLKGQEQHRSKSSSRHIYSRCYNTFDHSGELDLPYNKCSGGSYQNIPMRVTVVETGKRILTRTSKRDTSSEVRGQCLHRQELAHTIQSSLISGKLCQTSQLSYRQCDMTRNVVTLPPKHVRCNSSRISGWIQNSSGTGFTTATSSSRLMNYSSSQCNLGSPRSNNNIATKYNKESTSTNMIKNGIKNSYRNLNETIFDLSSEKGKRDACSGVTFAPADDERRSPVHDRVTNLEDACRRMSAPDLPPIPNVQTPRGDKRKISFNNGNSTEIKTLVSQRTAPFSTKTNYIRRSSAATADSCREGVVSVADDRFKKKFPTYRDHSDSSLNSLKASGSNQSKGSGSTLSSCSTPQAKAAGSSSNHGNAEVRIGEYRGESKQLGNGRRTLSLCASDLVDSQGKLDTLFEGQNSRTDTCTNKYSYIRNNNNNRTYDHSKLVNKYPISQSGTKKTHSEYETANFSNNNTIYAMPPVLRSSRSRPVSGIRNSEVNRLQTSSKKLIDEDWGNEEVGDDDVFITKGRVLPPNMEIKVSGKSTSNGNDYVARKINNNTEVTQRSIYRNQSVDRTERHRSSSQQPARGATPRSRQVGAYNMWRSTSVSNIYNKDPLNDVRQREEIYGTDDSIESGTRLVEWLNVVNNIDRYEIDPKNDVVDYSDEPPQTDTAVHVVYEGE